MSELLPSRARALLILSLLLLAPLSPRALGQVTPGRTVTTIHDGWRFYRGEALFAPQPNFDDLTWELVTLPHTYNRDDVMDQVRGYYMGPGWYRRRFVHQGRPGRRYHLRFEGVGQQAEVWLNGQRVGGHVGGYTAFQMDVTPYLTNGANTLVVRATNANNRNRVPISADFTFYGGIYRPVYLIETRETHLALDDTLGDEGVRARPIYDARTGRWSVALEGRVTRPRPGLRLEATLRGGSVGGYGTPGGIVSRVRLKAEAVGRGQQAVQRFTGQTAPLTNPRLWHPDEPFLYPIEFALLDGRGDTLDRLTQWVGLRRYRIDPDSGFIFNGRPMALHGASRHQDIHLRTGALPEAAHERDMILLKQMGGNFWRGAHYPHSPAAYRACDRLGIIVWSEIPMVNQITVSDSFSVHARQTLDQMIAQLGHHPSICIWGLSNEVYLQVPMRDTSRAFREVYAPALVTLHRQLNRRAKALDPERLTGIAAHRYERLYNGTGLMDIPDIAGWNLYHGWYHDRSGDVVAFLEGQHKQYPRRSHMLTEYGAGSDLRINSRAPEQYDFSNQYMTAHHRAYVEGLIDKPWMAALVIWNLVDFSSEGRRESMPGINNKGMLTTDRTAKDVYHYYRARFGARPSGQRPAAPLDGGMRLTTALEPHVYLAVRDWAERMAPPPGYGADTALIYTNTAGPVQVWVQGPGPADGRRPLECRRAPATIGGGQGVGVWQIVLPSEPGRYQLEARAGEGPGAPVDRAPLTILPRPTVGRPDTWPAGGLAINVGAAFEFYDPTTGQHWLPDALYAPAGQSNSGTGYGYLGGKVYRAGRNRVGIQDYIPGEVAQPIWQTLRDSLAGYRIDVTDGEYWLEIGLVEPKRVLPPTLYELAPGDPARGKGIRQFDWTLEGGVTILADFPRGYQPQQPGHRAVRVTVRGGRGIRLRPIVKEGGAVLSWVQVRTAP